MPISQRRSPCERVSLRPLKTVEQVVLHARVRLTNPKSRSACCSRVSRTRRRGDKLTCKSLLACNHARRSDGRYRHRLQGARRSEPAHAARRLHAKNGQTLTELCAGLEMTRHLAVLELLISSPRRSVGARSSISSIQCRCRRFPIGGSAKFERSRLRALRDLKRWLEATRSS